MFRDVRERRRGDAFQGKFGFLHAQHEQGHRAGLHDGRCELGVVSRDVSERPRGGFFHPRVELLEALDEGVERAGIHDSLRQRRGVFGDGSQDERGCLLVKSVLFAEGVDELGEDLVADDGFGEVVAVVGETPERDRGALLDAVTRWIRGGRERQRKKNWAPKEGDYRGVPFLGGEPAGDQWARGAAHRRRDPPAHPPRPPNTRRYGSEPSTHLGTLSSNRGRSSAMTPALCIGSMFCGRVASSATVCTKVTRSFWYFSNTCSTARVDAMVSETDEVVCLRASSDAACVPLWHARETQVTEVDDASNATRCRFWNRVKKVKS